VITDTEKKYKNMCITHGLCFLLNKLHNDAVNRSGFWWKKSSIQVGK